MEKQTIYVLLVEGDPSAAVAIRQHLAAAVYLEALVTHVESLAEAEVELRLHRYDVILADLILRDNQGLGVLDSLRRAAPDLPVILLAERLDDALAQRAIAGGAQDCLVKGRLAEDLVRAIRHAAGRKQAEESLTRERTLLRQLIDHLPSLIFFKDEAGRYVLSNRAHTAFLGAKTESEVIGKTVFDFFPPEVARVYQSDDQAVSLRGEAIVEREEPDQTGDSVVWFSTTKVPLKDAQGKLSGMIGVKQNITDRKRTEASLRQAEERYRSIFENAVEGIFQSTPEGRYITVNPAFARILGYDSPAEVIATCTDIGQQVYVNSSDRDRFRAQLAEHGVVVAMEHQAWRKDGSKVWLSLNGRVIRDNDDSIKYYEGSIEDITLRKQAESEIRHLAAFPQHNPNPVYEFTPDGALTYANDAAASLATDLGASGPSQILPADTIDIVKTCWREGRSRRRLETRHGNRIVSWSFFPIKAVGTVHCYAGEITEHKRAQEALRQSEERYQLAMRGMSAGLWDWNLTAGELFLGTRFKSLLGYSEEDPFEPCAALVSLAHPEDVPVLQQALNTGLSHDSTPFEVDCRLRDKGGAYRWYSVCGLSLCDAQGTPRRMAGSITDITERKRDEELLRISEERFRLLAKATNDTIWDWDIVKNLLWWSEGLEYMFGYRRDEVEPTLDSWTSRIHPDDYQRIHDDVDKVIHQGGTVWSGEYRFRCRDGSYAYVVDRGYVIRDDQGKPIRMIGGMTDLSDRKAAEEKLAQQAALLDQARDAIIVKDLEERIIYWNRSAERTYGWTSEEAVGRKASELFQIPTARFEEIKQELFKQGHAYAELRKKTKDGRELLVETRWSLMRNAVGQPRFILSINTDVTEKRKIEQQFLRSQRMESIGTLAGGIAHDLNNVLAPILMGIAMLRQEVTSKDGLHILSTLESSAERGASLIRQVLSFARGVQGQRVKLSLRHIVRDIQAITAETFPKSIVFKTLLPSEVWTVTGDPTNVHQVILNLCVNARDAMPDGGRLTVRLQNCMLDEASLGNDPERAPGPYVMVEVTDTGTGIPENIRHKIFEPFFTTKEVGTGTGLGLSTTLGIVKSHGGFVTVYSEPGKGSTFKIFFPADPNAFETEPANVDKQPLPSGEDRLILVVDDEAAIRYVARRILEAGGYKVLQAGNGAEALALYGPQMHEIAAVLTDITMPIMDGPTMVTALKLINPSAKIIGTSGLGSGDGKARALNAGMSAFIPKPYTSENLLKIVHQVVTDQFGG